MGLLDKCKEMLKSNKKELGKFDEKQIESDNIQMESNLIKRLPFSNRKKGKLISDLTARKNICTFFIHVKFSVHRIMID